MDVSGGCEHVICKSVPSMEGLCVPLRASTPDCLVSDLPGVFLSRPLTEAQTFGCGPGILIQSHFCAK